jgi:hypothetical protein
VSKHKSLKSSLRDSINPETHCSRFHAWDSRQHETFSICRDGPSLFCFLCQHTLASFVISPYTHLRPTPPAAHEHRGHAQVRNMPKRERIALVACQACRTRKSRVSLFCRAPLTRAEELTISSVTVRHLYVVRVEPSIRIVRTHPTPVCRDLQPSNWSTSS